jgi:hypothetical protein
MSMSTSAAKDLRSRRRRRACVSDEDEMVKKMQRMREVTEGEVQMKAKLNDGGSRRRADDDEMMMVAACTVQMKAR